MIEKFTKDNFNEKVNSKGIVIVDFWANWCGPCRMLGAILEEIEASHPEILIGKVDVDTEEELAVSFKINAIPHLFVYKDGSLVKDILGYTSKEEILEGIL